MVRTRRLEVVDDGVRVVAGMIHRDELVTIFGLVVRDENSRDRASVYEYDDGGAEMALDFGGNTVASLGVSDTGKPYLYFASDDQPWAE